MTGGYELPVAVGQKASAVGHQHRWGPYRGLRFSRTAQQVGGSDLIHTYIVTLFLPHTVPREHYTTLLTIAALGCRPDLFGTVAYQISMLPDNI